MGDVFEASVKSRSRKTLLKRVQIGITVVVEEKIFFVKKHRFYQQLSKSEFHETLHPSLNLCAGDTLNFFSLFLNLLEKVQKLLLLCYSKNSL